MSRLIAVLILQDSMRNKKRLKIRMGDDGALYYTLLAYTSGTSFSLANLALRDPLPDMRSDTLAGTMGAIVRALGTGGDRIIDTQMHATADKPAPCKPVGPTIWVINMDSRNYPWFVAATTEGACRREFGRMWNAWCKSSGADPYYWGHKGDKWAEVDCVEIELGRGYMDREIFR